MVLEDSSVPQDGDSDDALIAATYEHLRQVALAYLTPRGQTLQPTALVHEAYLKLGDFDAGRFKDREHFVCAAAQAMRHILVDHARARRAEKRGGGWSRITLSGLAGEDGSDFDAAAVSDALELLESINPRQGRIVELRFFGGLTIPQIAEAIGVSERTVKGDWRFARAWLRAALVDGRFDADAGEGSL